MQGIYSYTPETNHVYSVNSVAAVLYLQFVLHVMLFDVKCVLYFYISTFSSVCVQFPIWPFLSYYYYYYYYYYCNFLPSCAVSKLQRCYSVHCELFTLTINPISMDCGILNERFGLINDLLH